MFDLRMWKLREIYHPKKETHARTERVDMPGPRRMDESGRSDFCAEMDRTGQPADHSNPCIVPVLDAKRLTSNPICCSMATYKLASG